MKKSLCILPPSGIAIFPTPSGWLNLSRALVAALLSARAMVLDLSWYVTWARRDRARHTDGDVDALLAEFG